MTMLQRKPKLLLCRSFPKTHSLRAFLIGERQEVGGQAAGCVWQTSLQIARAASAAPFTVTMATQYTNFDALQVERT